MRSQRGEFPTWAKVLLAIVVVTVVGAVVIGGVLYSIGSKFMKSATSADQGSKTLHQFVKFEDPLPPGWKYAVNFDFSAVKMVSITDAGTHTMINFMEVPNAKHQSAEDLVANPATMNHASNMTQKLDIESRGEQMIGGQKVPYVRARITRTTGAFRAGQMQTGFIIVPTGKAIMIQVFENQAQYDPSLPEPILTKIKGFAQ